MPRRPVILPSGPYGSQNNAGNARKLPGPSIKTNNVAVKQEQFLGRPGLDSNTARALDQLQKNITSGVSPNINSPLANHQLISGFTFKLGQNVVPHGIGQPWKSVHLQNFIQSTNPPVAIGYSTQHNNPISLDAQQVLITVTAVCQADVVVYC